MSRLTLPRHSSSRSLQEFSPCPKVHALWALIEPLLDPLQQKSCSEEPDLSAGAAASGEGACTARH